jgi:MFS transporter, ACS family, glucarate transporter
MKPNKTSWSIVAMLSATATASYICRVNVSTAGPLLMSEFGLSQIEMGRVFSAFLLGYALFQVPAGALADRWGARRVLILAAWLWIGLTILQTLVGWGPIEATAGTALIVFMICRFLLGISESPTFPGAAQGVSRWVIPKFQGRANGFVIGAVGLGSAIAPLMVSNVMVIWGWRISLLVSAIPALIMALLWIRIKEPQHINSTPSPAQNNTIPEENGNSKNLRSRSFIFLTLSYSLQGYVGYIFVSWFYLYLVQERHFGLLTGAWMSSLPWVLSIVSIPLGGYISDRLTSGFLGSIWGRRIIPIIGMGFSGILISIGAHTDSAVMAAISLAFATALVLCVEGPFWATMMNLSGKKSGTAGGIMNMGCNIGGLISPALTPIIASYVGWENALHVAAGLAVIAALLWFGVTPEKE